MKTCEQCGKKMIGIKRFADHMATHAVENKIEIQPEPIAEPVAEVINDPITQIASQEIKLRFEKMVEITINGVQYHGKEVTAPNAEIAAEIVRIAREGYGYAILRS